MKNKETETINEQRRQALKVGIGISGTLLALSPISKALASACGLTPPQTEGPFYPVEHQVDEDSDLTQVQGLKGRAKGQVIYVQGIVQDQYCKPVVGAAVEIWQACASGRYKHPADTENPAPLDPYFQYWGRTLTGSDGSYLFKTIIPGAYPADTDWIRPPHIHYKVHKRGFQELTTQMYFQGETYNATDKILTQLSSVDQAKVIVALKDSGPQLELGSKQCQFDLTLTRL